MYYTRIGCSTILINATFTPRTWVPSYKVTIKKKNHPPHAIPVTQYPMGMLSNELKPIGILNIHIMASAGSIVGLNCALPDDVKSSYLDSTA